MAPADRSNSTSAPRSRRPRADSGIVWTQLLDGTQTASTLLWRLTDSVYFHLKRSHGQESEFVGISANHFRSLLKIVALEDDAKVEARARHFQAYLNHTGVDYQVVHRDGRQYATLNRRGWLTLLAWEVRVVPVYAYKWWKRLINHLSLVDPQTNLPFSSHPPRSVFPAKGDAQLLPIARNFVDLLNMSINNPAGSRRPRGQGRSGIAPPEASTRTSESAPPEHRVLRRRQTRPGPDRVALPTSSSFPDPIPPLEGPPRPTQHPPLSSHVRQASVSRSPCELEAAPVRSPSRNAEPFGTFPRRTRTAIEPVAAERFPAPVLSHSLSEPYLAAPRARESLRLDIPPYPGPVSLSAAASSSTSSTAAVSATALRPYATVGRAARRPVTMHELETGSPRSASPGRRGMVIMLDDPRLAYNPFVQLLAGQRLLEEDPTVPPRLREGPEPTNPFRHMLRLSRVEGTM